MQSVAAAANAANAASAADAANASKQTPAPGTPNGPNTQPTPHPYSTDNASISSTDFRRSSPEDTGPKSALAIYQGIAAAHEDTESIESTETSRLFYGPSSQFAFLQQVHRGILSSTGPHGQHEREVQEGGAGLDLFLQRIFFFGTASRVDPIAFHRPASQLFTEVPLVQARAFLEMFKSWSSSLLPFYSDTELDRMLQNLYSSDETRPSQVKAITLAILALGALASPHTDVAELLLARAKYEAVLFDDTVSLQMIQFSILQAEYQIQMGRPNLSYLNLGTACRKAFALGLHREAANSLARSEDVEKCRTTLWCLYSLESWYSMTVGRESSLKMSDISSPYPENQPFIVSLSRLAFIGENCGKVIYSQRCDSLRELYMAAEGIHAQLRNFADKHGIGSAGLASNGVNTIPEGPALLLLHNFYYHTILLNFRPFLVADYKLTAKSNCQTSMWLRQACRSDAFVQTSRYHGYYLESSCAVLFFDILRHPSKYPYNVEYIQMADQCLSLLINDEPLTNARNSLQKILRVVEDTISKGKHTYAATTGGLPAFADPILQTNADPTLQSPVSITSHDHPHPHASIQFPSLNAQQSPASQLIYFSELQSSMAADSTGAMTMPGMPGDPGSLAPGSEALDPMFNFHYDVITTDLYNFFPLQMSPQSEATGNNALDTDDGGVAADRR
ncbi:hypothetical protein VPNG_07537 [Cytospora leucostoma]|uniref:Xylanolytic transcriptional activator regulatory domain-containing protein n=1 Tax=Cytospora leucostoma TaxID=1230097 RepID=A0A423WS51_9PEZI|nr:hypothetical protein VPNG_07537 [Cytospora leucostoma]